MVREYPILFHLSIAMVSDSLAFKADQFAYPFVYFENSADPKNRNPPKINMALVIFGLKKWGFLPQQRMLHAKIGDFFSL